MDLLSTSKSPEPEHPAIKLGREQAAESFYEGTKDSENWRAGLGIAIAHATSWDGEAIVEIALAAFEDANFHGFGALMEELWLEHRIGKLEDQLKADLKP